MIDTKQVSCQPPRRGNSPSKGAGDIIRSIPELRRRSTMAKRLIATVALWVESFADGRPTVYPAEARCLECLKKKGVAIYYGDYPLTSRSTYV